MKYIKNVVLDESFFKRIDKLLCIDMSDLSKLSAEERGLNPKKNDLIHITSVQFDDGNTVNLNLYNDSHNYNIDYLISCSLANSDGIELKCFDNYTTLEKTLELNYLDNIYKINFWLCNTDVLKIGALEIKEVMDFFESNNDKPFKFFCEHFDAELEDLNSEEDIANGEEPWWEAIVYYKHLWFTMHENEIIPDIFEIKYEGIDESLDSTETYGGPMGDDKNPKYYKLWLPQDDIKEEDTVNNNEVKKIPMFLVVRTYNFDTDTCVRKFSTEDAALNFIKTDYESELEEAKLNEENICEDKTFIWDDGYRAEFTTEYYSSFDGKTYYDSIIWQLVTSVVDCQDD